MVVPEEAALSVPLVALVVVADVGRTEGDAAEGSPDVAAVAERTGGESSLALTSGGSHLPVRGEPLFRWMNPQDPTSTLFTLDDVMRAWSGRVSMRGLWPC